MGSQPSQTYKPTGKDQNGHSMAPSRSAVAPHDWASTSHGTESRCTHVSSIVHPLYRAVSVDLINDPRTISDNVLSRRLDAFASLVVTSMLLAGLAFTAITCIRAADVEVDDDGVEHQSWSWLNFFTLFGMVACLSFNLFTSIVMTQQTYMLSRVMTGGAAGFEIAKTLYLNPTVTIFRHMAVTSFNMSLPLFLISSSSLVYEKVSPMGRARKEAWSCMIFMWLVAGLMLYALRKQNLIFNEKWRAMQLYDAPMQRHMQEALLATGDDEHFQNNF